MHTLADLKAGQLKHATRLQLSENLTEFPSEIFDLADTLETLDLSGNALSRLPDDFARLTQLKVLFLSNNQFEVLPEILAQCPKLEMIGFKANRIHTVAENALPKATRWLILTDNQIGQLPDSMGQLASLQKLMLAGNKLTSLPESMANCRALQLLRISANELTALPEFLLQLPKLAWLAYSGNPFCGEFAADPAAFVNVSFEDIEQHEVLGQGASGVIYRASWVKAPAELADAEQPIAVKVFKSNVTSDGYPIDELHACLAAGNHDNLVQLLARVEQPGQLGLVMGLIPKDFDNLGEPPTFASCTRDHFDDDFMLSTEAVSLIANQMVDVLVYLWEQGICHGDLYAHNILINPEAEVLFGDFGAASPLAGLSAAQRSGLEKLEVRALGCLLEDLLGSSYDGDDFPDLFEPLIMLKNRCMHPKPAARPGLADIKAELQQL